MREKMLNVLEALFAAEKQTLDAMKEERRAIKTKGSLVIRMRKPYMLFTEKIDDREYGIMRDREKIRRLARKRFLEKAVADGEICCRLLAETIARLKSYKDRAVFPEGWEQVPELQAARFSAREGAAGQSGRAARHSRPAASPPVRPPLPRGEVGPDGKAGRPLCHDLPGLTDLRPLGAELHHRRV